MCNNIINLPYYSINITFLKPIFSVIFAEIFTTEQGLISEVHLLYNRG